MSFVDWIGFSKSLSNLNQKIKKNNRLKQEQLTGNVSIFRNQNQYRNTSFLNQQIVDKNTEIHRINDLMEFLKTSQSGINMVNDILDTMIAITQEASIVSKGGESMTEYNRHLIYLKDEFYNVIDSLVFKNRPIFNKVNSTENTSEFYVIDDGLKWEIPRIVVKGDSYAISSPGLSLEKIKLDNNCCVGYEISLETYQDFLYISNLVVLNTNKDRIKTLIETICQTITRLTIRKKTLQSLIENLNKRRNKLNTGDDSLNNLIIKNQKEIDEATKYLPNVYSDNKNRYPNI